MKQQLVLVRISKPIQDALEFIGTTGCTPYTAAKHVGCDKVSLYRAVKYGTVMAADGNLYLNNDAYRIWKEAAEIYVGEKLSLAEFTRRFRFKPESLRRNLPIFGIQCLNDNRIEYRRDIFRVIDSEEAAYWYGFLLADGGIYKNELRLKLAAGDVQHLERFCRFIGGDPAQLIREERHGATGNTLVKVVLASSELVGDLRSHGLDYRKSCRERVPAFAVSAESAYDVPFMRGVFDGDGCIRSGFQHLSLIGSRELLEFFSDRATARCGTRAAKIHDYDTYLKAYWYGQDKYKLAGLLYGNSGVHLQRKHDLVERYAVLAREG